MFINAHMCNRTKFMYVMKRKSRVRISTIVVRFLYFAIHCMYQLECKLIHHLFSFCQQILAYFYRDINNLIFTYLTSLDFFFYGLGFFWVGVGRGWGKFQIIRNERFKKYNVSPASISIHNCLSRSVPQLQTATTELVCDNSTQNKLQFSYGFWQSQLGFCPCQILCSKHR